MECGAVWVRVSLGAYFSDERARCMMMVPGGGGARRAGWLARRLRRTFGLPRRPALLCQGHLLPPAEPLPTRAPLLQLEAVPPSGRVVDVSRQRASDADDDSDSQAVRVRAKRPRRRQLSDQLQRDETSEPAPLAPPTQHEQATELPDADEKDEVDGLASPSLDEMKRRALALLEGQGGVRRRRHRVRRRRPAPAPAPEPQHDEVLHNEESSRRAPRHVRALSPAPAPAPAVQEPPVSPRHPATDGHDPLFTSQT